MCFGVLFRVVLESYWRCMFWWFYGRVCSRPFTLPVRGRYLVRQPFRRISLARLGRITILVQWSRAIFIHPSKICYLATSFCPKDLRAYWNVWKNLRSTTESKWRWYTSVAKWVSRVTMIPSFWASPWRKLVVCHEVEQHDQRPFWLGGIRLWWEPKTRLSLADF